MQGGARGRFHPARPPGRLRWRSGERSRALSSRSQVKRRTTRYWLRALSRACSGSTVRRHADEDSKGGRDVLTVSVERVVAAPLGDVFEWLSDASNYTRSRFVLHERLVRPGDDAAYGIGAVRQLTWAFGWFRERITAYRPPHEFRYLVERSVPPL